MKKNPKICRRCGLRATGLALLATALFYHQQQDSLRAIRGHIDDFAPGTLESSYRWPSEERGGMQRSEPRRTKANSVGQSS
eukprot:scaffold3995_cov133-Skeletonema_menzelii.AAC.6